MANQLPSIESINELGKDTLLHHLGMVFTSIGSDFLECKMPVDHRTRQTAGILHGGASAALMETLGSLASSVLVDRSKYYCVGLEINANHIRGVDSGWVYGRAEALHMGRKTHVWEIKITNEAGKLVSVGRHTVAVLERP